MEQKEFMYSLILRGGSNRLFRLQMDETWKKNLGLHIQGCESPYLTKDPDELKQYIPKNMKVMIENVEYLVNPVNGTTIGQNVLFSEVLVYRKSYPSVPSKEELVSVIRSGDDNRTNVLILTIDGHFQLVDIRTLDAFDPNIVAKYEAFCSGNGYVGVEASKDVDAIYAAMLKTWKEHLEYSITNEFVADLYIKSISETLGQLKKMESKWTPQF